jgi:signal transduction histidine kinase
MTIHTAAREDPLAASRSAPNSGQRRPQWMRPLVAWGWSNWLPSFRLLLGLLCAVLSLGVEGPHARNLFFLWTAYAVYSLLALSGRSLERIGFSLLSLLVDTIFFLISAALPLEYNVGVTSLFYLYILLSAAMLHTAREVFSVVVATLAFFYWSRPTEILVLSPALLLSGSAVIIMAMQRKALQDRLAATSQQALLFRSEAEQARESERQRIAHDFHDGPLQCFVGLQMRLEVLRKVLEKDPAFAAAELASLQADVKGHIEEIRTFVRNMRPPEIEGTGLIASIKSLTEKFQRESGVSSTLVGSAVRVSPGSALATEILLIVREALHNIQKHAAATEVTVGVGRDGEVFELSVSDNGAGFPEPGSFTLEEMDDLRLGPVSIRNRVRRLNGQMMLASYPGQGSSLKIRLPL